MKKQNIPYFRRKCLILLVLLASIFLISFVEGTSAKYVKDLGTNDTIIRAKEFYFSSDLLKEGGSNYTLNPGTKSITFELRNHDDQLRYSEDNLIYEVTVDNGATVKVLLDTEPQQLTGGKISNHRIQISGLQDGVTYTVTATGRAGYEKILSATFTVKKQNEGAYKYLQMDPSGAFVLLTVWTENVSGNVTISTTLTGLIPDATDDALAEIKNYNQDNDGTKYSAINGASAGFLDPYSSHTYRFFLETPFTQYQVKDITVTVGNTTAGEKTPS